MSNLVHEIAEVYLPRQRQTLELSKPAVAVLAKTPLGFYRANLFMKTGEQLNQREISGCEVEALDREFRSILRSLIESSLGIMEGWALYTSAHPLLVVLLCQHKLFLDNLGINMNQVRPLKVEPPKKNRR